MIIQYKIKVVNKSISVNIDLDNIFLKKIDLKQCFEIS
jgi:hypothetical protein